VELFLIIVVFLLCCLACSVIKDMDAKAELRADERIMAAHERDEETRAHCYRLMAIERTRANAIDELYRIADEARGEVIEGTAREIKERSS
jgi:hypothetical protein